MWNICDWLLHLVCGWLWMSHPVTIHTLPRTNNSILQLTWGLTVVGVFITFMIQTLNAQLSEVYRVLTGLTNERQRRETKQIISSSLVCDHQNWDRESKCKLFLPLGLIAQGAPLLSTCLSIYLPVVCYCIFVSPLINQEYVPKPLSVVHPGRSLVPNQQPWPTLSR